MGVRDEHGRLRARLILPLLLLSLPVVAQPADTAVFGRIREPWRPLARFLSRPDASRLPVDGNRLTLYSSGRPMFEELERDIRASRDNIRMEFYRFMPDTIGHEIRDLLIRRAEEGIDIRLLLEMRSNDRNPAFYRTIIDSPVRTSRFARSGVNLDSYSKIAIRDHRKIVILDDRILYIGGMNIQDRYRSAWRDTHLRLEGPAAGSAARIFDAMWQGINPTDYPRTTGECPAFPDGSVVQVIEDGPDSPEDWIRMALAITLECTQDRFFLETPYFMPSPSLLRSLKNAARRGVDVRIVFPIHSDVAIFEAANRSYYRELLQAGIRLYERQPPFSHSKAFVADGYLVCLGSANTDSYSLHNNYEENVYIYDERFAGSVEEMFFADVAVSDEMHADSLHFKHSQRYLQGLTRILRPYL